MKTISNTGVTVLNDWHSIRQFVSIRLQCIRNVWLFSICVGIYAFCLINLKFYNGDILKYIKNHWNLSYSIFSSWIFKLEIIRNGLFYQFDEFIHHKGFQACATENTKHFKSCANGTSYVIWFRSMLSAAATYCVRSRIKVKLQNYISFTYGIHRICYPLDHSVCC